MPHRYIRLSIAPVGFTRELKNAHLSPPVPLEGGWGGQCAWSEEAASPPHPNTWGGAWEPRAHRSPPPSDAKTARRKKGTPRRKKGTPRRTLGLGMSLRAGPGGGGGGGRGKGGSFGNGGRCPCSPSTHLSLFFPLPAASENGVGWDACAGFRACLPYQRNLTYSTKETKNTMAAMGPYWLSMACHVSFLAPHLKSLL